MHASRRLGLSLGFLTLALLQACGGGSPEATSAAQPAAADAEVRPLNMTLTRSKPSISNEELFDWAERQYPSLFPAGAQTGTLEHEGRSFRSRYYPSTGSHLGIVNGGVVYGAGGFTQGQLQRLGTIESFTCQVVGSAACGPAPEKVVRVYSSAGGQQCVPGSGVPLQDMRRRLTAAGVRVSHASCAYAPVAVPSVCGASDARIWIFEIEAADLGKVPAGDFVSLDTLGTSEALSWRSFYTSDTACEF